MTLYDKLRFRLAAWQNDDAVLGRGAAPLAELLQEMTGKRIAIVGNARALARTDHGALIDGCDLVIRINRAPMPRATSHGTQTNWLSLATSLSQVQFEQLGAQRLIWMSHKRKRLKYWMAQTFGFTLFSQARYRDLKARLNAQPTTGALLIDFATQSKAAEVHLFGFDFFASQSLSGSRNAAQTPHDFDAEAKWANALITDDPRLTLHSME